WWAENVPSRPAPLRRSQTEKPISLRPSSGPAPKCSSASASFPGGLPRSFIVIFTVIVAVVVAVVAIFVSSGAELGGSFRRLEGTTTREPTRRHEDGAVPAKRQAFGAGVTAR